jgi:protein-tyrosine-phosphatase
MSTESTNIRELAARYTLSIDHQQALRAASRRLNEEFAGLFNSETVERFLAGSYEQYATAAKIPNYVHIFAERFARQRLFAFARVEGHLSAARPIVLFVCVANDLYSPMARGLFERLAGPSALAWSAGLKPGVGLRDGVADAMNGVGVSMVDEFPNPIAPEMLSAATTVVTFGCAEDTPVLPGREYYAVPAPIVDISKSGEVEKLRGWLDDGMRELYQSLFPAAATTGAPGHRSVTYAP